MLNYYFNFLGGKFYKYKKNGKILWSLDPINNKKFSNNFDYKKKQNMVFKSAEIKYSWELSRLHQIFITSVLHFQTKKFFFLKSFKDQINDFIDNNKVGRSVAWNNAMECSIRSINLISSLEFIELNTLEKKLSNKIINFLNNNLKYIVENLEYSLHVNSNHYLHNIIGLIYLSHFFENKKILDQSIKEFCNEINIQFSKNGENFENSFNYHRFNLEGILHVLVLLKSLNIKLNKKTLDKIKKSTHFLFAIMKQDKTIPIIGDNDNGRVLIYSDYFNYFLDDNSSDIACNLANYFYNENFNFTNSSSRKNEKKIFKFLNKNKNLSSKNFEKIYKDSGIYILKKNKNYFLSTNSKVGTGGIGNHKHNDNFSFCLSFDDDDFFQDIGTFHYGSDLLNRYNYRSIYNHNSFQKLGEEPNNLNKKKPWNAYEDSYPKNFVKYENNITKIFYFRAYMKYPKKTFYERSFEINKKNFNIKFEDKLNSNYNGIVRWSFNLGHKVKIKKKKQYLILFTNKKKIILQYDQKLKYSIKNIYVYPSFGKKIKSKKIIFQTFSSKNKFEKFTFNIIN